MTGPHQPRPRETPDRCSVQAQLRGDPMLGTAFPAARLLLVEQPGPWGRGGLVDSHFGARTAAALHRRAAEAGIRVLAIRRPGRPDPTALRRWALADTRDGHPEVRWSTYRDPGELLDAPLDGSVGESSTDPVYLVCAHSKHDACCALRGRPVAAALHELRPDAVWECSHVGGDRFAANVLVLPVGLLYGQVLPMAAEEFVAAAESGEVVGALLRGRVGLAPVAQAALAFAHEHLALRRHTDLQVSGRPVRAAGGSVQVGVRSPHGALTVTVRPVTVQAAGLTCHAPGAGSYVAYRPVSIVPDET